MKKLIISIVATASIALVAKADVAPNATSFETYPENVAFDVGLNDNGGEGGYIFWSGGDAGSEFLIKALVGEGGLGAKSVDVDRPKYWAGQSDDAKALSIDTDVALSRHVNADRIAQDIGNGLYFDSMVQFTATDTAPTVTETAEGVTGDKLIVWLREVVAAENETPATYALYVTAGVKYQNEIKTTHYELTSVADIAPDSWHRLTIAISKTGATPTFKVYVDGEQATSTKIYNPDGDYETITAIGEFGSLTLDGANNAGTITSVDFKGKGAIDDLVWTTEDPYAPVTKPLSVMITDEDEVSLDWTLVYSGLEDAIGLALGKENALSVPATVTSVTISCNLQNGYNLTEAGFTPGVKGDDYTPWTREITLGETNEFAFEVVQDEVAPANFTVDDKPFATFAEAIEEVATNGGTIVIAEDAAAESLVLAEMVEIAANTTINFNGKTLTSTANPAIKVTAGTLTLTGEGGITAPWVVIQQGEKNGGETTTVNVDANVKLLSRNELPKTGNNGFGDNVVYLCGKATLNVAGTLETDSDYYCAIQTSGEDELAEVAITITGTVINNNEVAIGLNLYKNAKGSLIVDDGASITGKSGIYAKSGSVTISGGTITATGKLGDASNEPGGTATGNALVVDKNSSYADLTVAVTGGTFNGYNGEAAIASVGEEIVGFVTGGMFNTEIAAALLGKSENGKELELVEAETDGYWTVAEKKADEKPTVGESELEADDFADPQTVNSTTEVTLPDGWKVSEDNTQILNKDNQPFVTFPSYYTATVVGGVIKLALNDTVKPVIAESKVGETTVKPMEFAKEGEADVVKLNVPVRNGNLFYGVKAAGTLTGLDGATPAWATARGVNPPAVPKSGNAQFFRVVVTDVLPAQN